MRAYNITKDTVKDIAEDLGLDVSFGTEHNNGFNFTLKWRKRDDPEDMRYRHKSISWNHERYTPNVCYHGYFDFMYELFLKCPNARVTSSRYGKVDYRSMESFQEQARDLAHKSIGAPIMGGYPTLIESCECGAMGYGIVHDMD